MAKSIMSLTAQLILDSISYENGMKRAAKLSQTVEDKLLSSAKRIAAGGAAYFTADALMGYVNKSFDAAEATKDLAEQARISIDRVQTLGYVARQNGTEAEVLTGAMQNLTKSVQDAMDGSASAQMAFARLGLQFRELHSLAPDARFEVVSRQLSLLRKDTETVNAVMDMLGSKHAPKATAAMIQLGEQGFDGAAQAARDAGQVWGEETVVQLAQARQAIDDVMHRWTILVGTVTSAFMGGTPTEKWQKGLEAVDHQLDVLAGKGNFFKRLWDEQTLRDDLWILSELASKSGSIDQMTVALAKLRAVADASSDSDIDEYAFQQIVVLENQVRLLRAKAAASQEAKNAAQKLTDAERERLELEQQLTLGVKEGIALGREHSDVEDMVTRAIRAQVSAMERRNAMYSEGQSLTESVLTPMERYEKQLQRIDELESGGFITGETASRAYGQAGAAFSDANAQIEDMASRMVNANDKSKDLVQTQNEWARSTELIFDRAEAGITEAFIDSLEGAEGAWEDLGRTIVRQVAAMAVQLAIVRPLVAGVMGYFGFGGAVAAAGGAGAPAAHASGGRFSAGDTMLVGERGPELMEIGAGGAITPSGATERIMSGGGALTIVVHLTQNYESGVSRQEILAMQPEMVRMTTMGVVHALQRSPLLRAQALGG